MISTKFIEECKNRANANRLGKIIIDGIEKPITNSDNLQSFSIDSGCYVDGNIVGSVYAKCLKANFITDIADLSEKSIHAQIGVKYDDKTTEYASIGKYMVERPNNEITANMSQIVAYDNLYTNLDNKYVCGIDYSKGNITVKDLYIDVCKQLGLTPKTTSFLNDNIPIEDNPFTNGEKNRTVLQTVCKISCSFVDVDVETNEIDLCWLSQNEEPDYTFYKNDYVSVEGGQVVCGPINCLIIKNSQIDSENVTKKDDKDIALNGEHSIIISEDYILHNEELRQLAISNIWNRVHGMKYVDCKLTTYYGKPFLKLGNKIRVYIDDENTKYFDTYVLKHNFTYDGSFNSIIESPALTQQEIKSKQDISLGQALKNTQIDVDKQKQRITALVQDTTETKDKVTELEATTDGIKTSVSTVEKGLATTNSNLEQTNKNVTDLTTKVNGLTINIEDLEDFKDNEFLKYIKNLQDQIDGIIQFWNGSEIPTLNNFPANQWVTEEDKNNHRADIYTVIDDSSKPPKQGKSYRFDKVNGVWQWVELTDNELSAVQALAQQALDKSTQNEKDIGVLNKKTSELSLTDEQIKASVEELNNQYEQDITITKTIEGNNTLYLENALESNALEYVIEGKSEQETRSGKNLMDSSKLNTSSGYGLTFNYNDNGSISFKGTTTTVYANLTKRQYNTLPSNTKYTFSIDEPKTYTVYIRVYTSETDFITKSISSGQTSITFQEEKDILSYYAYIGGFAIGTVFDGTIYLQLENGDKTTSFEKYGAMPSPEFPSEVKSICGFENLFVGEMEDGKLDVNNGYLQNSTTDVRSKEFSIVKPNTEYIVSNDGASIAMNYFEYDSSKKYIKYTNVGLNKSFTTSSNTKYVKIWRSKTTDVSKIQIEKGTVINPYIPYGHWAKVKVTGKQLYNYKDTATVSSEITVDDNGWITIVGNNSSGNSSMYKNYYTNNLNLKKNGEYTIITEIKSISGNGIYHSASNSKDSQITQNTSYNIQNLTNNSILIDKVIAKDNFDDATHGLRTFITFTSGQSGSITFRISVLEDTTITPETFIYGPYKEQEVLINLNKENLFDYNYFFENSTYPNTTTVISRVKIKLKPSTKYNISTNSLNSDTNITNVYAVSGDNLDFSISAANNGIFPNKPLNITSDENGNIVIGVRTKDNSVTREDFDNGNIYIKIYEGTSPQDYYELSSIDDTRDSLEVVSGKFTEKNGEIILTGDENWGITTTSNNNFRFYLNNFVYYNDNDKTNIICTHFKTKTPSETYLGIEGISAQNGSQLLITYEVEGTTNSERLTNFKLYLNQQYNNGTPVTVDYVLETPQTYQLKPTNIQLFEGINHVELLENIETNTKITYLTNSKLNAQYATKTELKLTADSITSEVNKKVSTDNFNSTISDLDSKITQTAENIRSEVSSTKTELNQNITNAVNNIEIGGRNYVLGTSNEITITGNGGTNQTKKIGNFSIPEDLVGKQVTSQITYEVTSSTISGTIILQSGSPTYAALTSKTNLELGTHTIIKTMTLLSSFAAKEVFIRLDNVQGTIIVKKIKVEIGNKATDWTPAPEDTDSAIDDTRNQLLSTETKLNERIQTVDETTSTLSATLNNNYMTAEQTQAQIQTNVDQLNLVQQQISEVQQRLTEFNINFSTINGTISEMSYNFNTDRLRIAKSDDPINSTYDNKGVKIFNYSTLSAIFTDKGSGIDKLIVTGTAQIGYLKFVKNIKNGEKCTTIHVLDELIENLTDLESD